MTYGQHSTGVDRVTRSRPRETQAQYSRRTGPLLPMDQPKRGFLARVLGR